MPFGILKELTEVADGIFVYEFERDLSSIDLGQPQRPRSGPGWLGKPGAWTKGCPHPTVRVMRGREIRWPNRDLALMPMTLPGWGPDDSPVSEQRVGRVLRLRGKARGSRRRRRA